MLYKKILKKLKNEKLHFTLIDPEKVNSKKAEEVAVQSRKAGTDGFLVGGSTTKLTQKEIDNIVKGIKKVKLPVILFPSNASSLSRYADAIFFMSLLNSKSPRFLIEEQVKGSFFVKKFKIEPIGMGYIVVEPGMKVGKVGEVNLIPRNNPNEVIGYCLAAEYFGMKLVYLEAGSGADMSVPFEMVKIAKENLTVPLIVGGGIRNEKIAKKIVKSGADIIITGTIVEESENIENTLGKIVKAIKS